MNFRTIIFIWGILISVISCTNVIKDGQFDIRDYGAVGDSIQINTRSIQLAIDACHKKGGGTVVIKEGIYISGTVLLKDNVTIHINENASLIGSSNPNDYQSIDTFVDATGQERGNCLIGAVNASNIKIIGKGTIDGNGTAFLHKNIVVKKKELGIDDTDKKFGINRPFLLRFVKSSTITIRDIKLRQPAAWTCHFYQSHDIMVDNISIYSHAHHNNDGIDLDSSFNATIKNCSIDTGDDAICFKTTSPLPTHTIKVTNCTLKSEWGALKFGTESMGDFYNIQIRDCQIRDTRGGGIKMLSVDGANIHDIDIDGIKMDSVDMPVFIRLGERLRTYRNASRQKVGSIHNVTIKNITGSTRNLKTSRISPPSGIFITGTPNHKIGTIKLQNIDITLPGGGISSGIKEVSEQVDKYPEYSFFEVLPGYGIFGRHLEYLEMSNIHFKTDTNDQRPPIFLNDVKKSIKDGIESTQDQQKVKIISNKNGAIISFDELNKSTKTHL
ncbi:glycoside hydrolase family 28 protein [Aquimarina sp. RZ0]|uniref:glycoside hydrolase family 28 protein n=1 Tax=Aquimarina sp. RZ0 TaxID=2607730 RepID=UPI0011F23B44|nr:glycosyl hydrolase family 28 protein [Aquimarina sp. RZ0]KAA1244766.1 glycoside hydrolase family 28 protein [Aquimarina sp. RZ0]